MFRRILPSLACAALVIAGCGDDAGSAAGDTAGGKPAQERLTKEEYIAQADAICAETADEEEAITDRIAEIDRGNISEGLAAILKDRLKKTRAGYRRVKALRPPAADQAAVDDWLSVVDQTLDRYGTIAAGLRGKRRTALQRATREGRKLDGEQEILADLLGLVDCRNLV